MDNLPSVCANVGPSNISKPNSIFIMHTYIYPVAKLRRKSMKTLHNYQVFIRRQILPCKLGHMVWHGDLSRLTRVVSDLISLIL